MTVKVFFSPNNMAQFKCPKCGDTKAVNVSKYISSNNDPKLKCICKCGHIYTAVLERRKEGRKLLNLEGNYVLLKSNKRGKMIVKNLSPTGILIMLDGLYELEPIHKILLEFALDNKEKTFIRKEAVIVQTKKNYVHAKFDSKELDSKIDIYLRAMASESRDQSKTDDELKPVDDTKTIICPKCQKKQPVSPECIYCGVVFLKYHKKNDEKTNEKITELGDNKVKALKHTKLYILIKTNIKSATDLFKKFDKKTTIAGSITFAAVLFFIILFIFFFDIRKMSTEKVVSNAENSVALINHDWGNGSGFIVAKNILATNFHVISDVFPEDVEIYFPAVSNKSFKAGRIIFYDENRDLAFIEVKTNSKPLVLCKKSSLRHGEDLVIIGNPGISSNLILKNSVTRGSLNSRSKPPT